MCCAVAAHARLMRVRRRSRLPTRPGSTWDSQRMRQDEEERTQLLRELTALNAHLASVLPVYLAQADEPFMWHGRPLLPEVQVQLADIRQSKLAGVGASVSIDAAAMNGGSAQRVA